MENIKTYRFVIEEYLDGLWLSGYKKPEERLTDLPPAMVKLHHLGDAADWEAHNDKLAYQKAYDEFAKELQQAFQRHAGPGEVLEIVSDCRDSFWNSGPSSEIEGALERALDEVGLPTRADVERWVGENKEEEAL